MCVTGHMCGLGAIIVRRDYREMSQECLAHEWLKYWKQGPTLRVFQASSPRLDVCVCLCVSVSVSVSVCVSV